MYINFIKKSHRNTKNSNNPILLPHFIICYQYVIKGRGAKCKQDGSGF